MQSYDHFEYAVERKRAEVRGAVERSRLIRGSAGTPVRRGGLAHVLAVALRGMADRLEAPARIAA